jgi:hypothetical protein
MFDNVRKVVRNWILTPEEPEFTAEVSVDEDGFFDITVVDITHGDEMEFHVGWEDMASVTEAVLSNKELTTFLCLYPGFAEELAAHLYERDPTGDVQ